MHRSPSLAAAACAALVIGSSVAAADAGLPDIQAAVAAVGSRIPSTCKGINQQTDHDPRFGHVTRFATDLNGRRVAAYEIHLALEASCAKATVKAVSRAVRRGLRIAPGRPVSKFAVFADGPTDLRDIMIFYVPVADDAEWKRIGG